MHGNFYLVFYQNIIKHLVEARCWRPVLDLSWAIATFHGYLDVFGRWGQRLVFCRAAIQAAQSLNDRAEECIWLDNLGSTLRKLGRVAESVEIYQQSLDIARELRDRRKQGIGLGNLGNAYRALGQVENAIENYEAALAIDQEIGNRRGEGICLHNLGVAYADLGDKSKARHYYRQSLAIKEEILPTDHPHLKQTREALAALEAGD